MSTNELSSPREDDDAQAGRSGSARGRYAKFNGSMDVLLLEALRDNNPFTAKHGTRLQMWQNIAEIVGEQLFKNREAYSWHTCRDRVTALLKMYSEGKHEKLFKHGTIEENARKESILREVTNAIARKSARVFSRPSAFLENVKERKILGQKRRKMDGNGGGNSILLGGNNGNSSSGQQLDSETFRARVLELIESKIQFDMEQRVKENELREQEFDLQKRFLEYLQSK